MTPAEILQKIANSYSISLAKLALKCGYDRPQAFYDVANGKTKTISGDMANKIVAAFPELNLNFILTGEGEFLKHNCSITDNSEDYIYLLPVSAQAGKLNDFIASVKEGDCERIVSPIKDAEFAITITGESMAPEYPNGSRAFVKKIDAEIFVEWGRDYVVDTSNGIVVKRLIEPEKEGHLRCVSINPDQKKYAPFDVPTSEVYGIYRILLCMSLK